MDKTRHIKLKHFHENDGGRAKNGTQSKQCGKECKPNYFDDRSSYVLVDTAAESASCCARAADASF